MLLQLLGQLLKKNLEWHVCKQTKQILASSRVLGVRELYCLKKRQGFKIDREFCRKLYLTDFSRKYLFKNVKLTINKGHKFE